MKKYMKYIDLSEYCQLRFIRKGEDSFEPEPDVEEIWLDEKYLKDGKLEGGDFSFRPASGPRNLLECQGQRIPLSGKGFRYLDIAGFSLFGNYQETIWLVGDTGARETALYLQDICNPGLPCVTTEKEWSRNYHVDACILDFCCAERKNLCIFAQRLELAAISNLKEIVLPDNFFMHILAMTLSGEGK